MVEYVTIEKVEMLYMLPVLISYGYVHIYCESFEIDDLYLYAYVNKHVVLGMHMLDIKEIRFLWRC